MELFRIYDKVYYFDSKAWRRIMWVLMVVLAILISATICRAEEPVKHKIFIVKAQTIRNVTAYNAGDPGQCDDTPCISANGQNICAALARGEAHCAANFVPLGSWLRR